MKNKGRADNEGYNTLLWAPRGCQERKDALLVAWVGGFFAVVYSYFFPLARLPAKPCSRIPARQYPAPLTRAPL